MKKPTFQVSKNIPNRWALSLVAYRLALTLILYDQDFHANMKDKTDNYNYNSWDDTVPDYPSDEEDTISNNYIPLDIVSTTISAGTLGYGTHALVPELDPGISLHLMLTSF